jgi:hypothetical protein
MSTEETKDQIRTNLYVGARAPREQAALKHHHFQLVTELLRFLVPPERTATFLALARHSAPEEIDEAFLRGGLPDGGVDNRSVQQAFIASAQKPKAGVRLLRHPNWLV